MRVGSAYLSPMIVDSRAVLTRAAPAPDVTVAYGEHQNQIADLRRPTNRADGPRPLVIVVHGGFWRAEYDRTHTGLMAADLAARGYPVAQLEYRRTGQPGGGWPGTLDDVLAGVSALPELAITAFPGLVHPGPPILLGHSAGGQLALITAACLAEQVRGVLALAPIADLRRAYELDLDDGAVAALLGGGPREVPERYAVANPCECVPPRSRVVVIHGELDQQVPIDMSRSYATAAATAGGDIYLIEVKDCEHFGLIDPTGVHWPWVLVALQSLNDGGQALTQPRLAGRTPEGL